MCFLKSITSSKSRLDSRIFRTSVPVVVAVVLVAVVVVVEIVAVVVVVMLVVARDKGLQGVEGILDVCYSVMRVHVS